MAAKSHRIRQAARIEEGADGSVLASFAVQRGRKTAVLSLLVHASGDEVTAGSAVLPAPAVDLPAQALLDLVDARTLGHWECRALGLYGDVPGEIADAFLRFAENRPSEAARRSGDALSQLELRYGTPRSLPACLAGIDAAAPIANAGIDDGSTPVGRLVYPDRIPAAVKPWIDRITTHVHGPVGLRFLSHEGWGGSLADWALARGDIGERRRQAARLQSGFAPVLTGEPTVSAAIDAGLPFEPELLRILREWLPPGHRDGLDLPRLRRLRGIDFAGLETARSLLSFAARVPLHLLPAPGGSPLCLAWAASFVMEDLDAMGLDLDTVLGSPLPGWLSSRGSPTDGDGRIPALRGRLNEARRVATLLAEDLVLPLMGDWRYRGRAPDAALCLRLSGSLLFEGLPIARIAESSRKWHEDLRRLRKAAGGGVPDLGWPALFEPYECGEGVTITCLTTAQELENEGGRGPDPWTGMDGLDHCVGTYAQDCCTGRLHVASLTAGGRRLSTVALKVDPHKDRLRVSEHHGLRNSDPPPLAAAALERFLQANLRGEVWIEPAALERREPPPKRPDTPETVIRRVHAAWRPHLRHGAESPLALEAHLADLLRSLDPHDASQAA